MITRAREWKHSNSSEKRHVFSSTVGRRRHALGRVIRIIHAGMTGWNGIDEASLVELLISSEMSVCASCPL